MARLFDIFTVTDEGLADLIKERNFDISVEAFRAELDVLLDCEKNSPAIPGAETPDFEAEKLSPNGERTGEMFRLSSLRGKVTALMFGSYTCPVCSGKMSRHQAIYEELRDRIEFVWVYTYEAHPFDGWHLESNENRGVRIKEHKDLDDRAAAAESCMLGAGLTVPMVLDGTDNKITHFYNGQPERLYVIDPDGVIVFRSSIGPFDQEDVDNWHQALLGQVH